MTGSYSKEASEISSDNKLTKQQYRNNTKKYLWNSLETKLHVSVIAPVNAGQYGDQPKAKSTHILPHGMMYSEGRHQRLDSSIIFFQRDFVYISNRLTVDVSKNFKFFLVVNRKNCLYGLLTLSINSGVGKLKS